MYSVWHSQVWMVPFHVLCMHEPFAHHSDCYIHEGMLATTVAKKPFWRCVAYSAPRLDTANWYTEYGTVRCGWCPSMCYACVNHLHTTPIVIIMKGCLQQPLPRNLLSDVWHMVRHVRTQRIDVECIVQPNRTCNSVTFGRHAQLKNNKQTCVVYYIAYSTVQNILVHTLFFLCTIYA